ncbi:MAG TPA: helix-turn-helix transcriptional regulator, partial [Streptosporangiaceae bacterium]|nr:helix-turn-helix transcriptional regulator [Streptosporangiaceae bacterium]
MTAGVISGALLQAARRTAGLTQEQLAEGLGADVATVKGWETGRRPLCNVQAGRLVRVRRYLRAAGAHPELLAQLDTAIDADAFAAQAIAGDCSQLGAEVTTRAWHALIGWAVRGDP